MCEYIWVWGKETARAGGGGGGVGFKFHLMLHDVKTLYWMSIFFDKYTVGLHVLFVLNVSQFYINKM
jgi:hypothetical protein